MMHISNNPSMLINTDSELTKVRIKAHKLFHLKLTYNISEPKNRQAWLKVWFDKLEQAELENYEVFEVTEENDEELVNEDLVFVMPTVSDIAQAIQDRKISSSSEYSNCSYYSNLSEG